VNPDMPKPPREELEVRLTALLLGELPAEEADALREIIAKDAQLAGLYERFKRVIDLVREAAATATEPATAQAAPLRLSDERRQKLLAHFKTVAPKEFVPHPRREWSWLVPLGAAAAAITLLAAIAVPGISRRESAQANSVLHNLRILEGAKDQWALENKKSADDVVTLGDLKDYLKAGTVRSVLGENYIVGRVSDPITADFDAAQAKKTFGDVATKQPPQEARGQRARLNAAAELTLVDKNGMTPATAPGGGVSSATVVLSSSRAPQEEKPVAAKPSAPSEAPPAPVKAFKNGVAAQPMPLTQANTREVESVEVRHSAATPRQEIVLPPSSEQAGTMVTASAKGTSEQPGYRFFLNAGRVGGVGGGGGIGGGGGGGFGQVGDARAGATTTSAMSNPDRVGVLDAPAPSNLGSTNSFIARDPFALRPPGSDSDLTAFGLQPAKPAENLPPVNIEEKLGGILLGPNTAATSPGSAEVLNRLDGSDQLARKRDRIDYLYADQVPRLNVAPEVGRLFWANPDASDAEGKARSKVETTHYYTNAGNLSTWSAVKSGVVATQHAELSGKLDQRVERLGEASKEQAMAGVQALEEKLAEQDTKIAQAKERLDRLQRETSSDQADAIPPKSAAPAPTPQPEVQTRVNAFSTFALNVSDVSFKLAGASLEKGVMPEPATVRSEEFINAFDYRDPEPPPGVPIAFAWERTRYPFAHNRDLLRFSVKTAAAGRQPGRALNLVLLLDNSGSMERADRVQIINEALRVLAAQLQPQDKLSVVTFARTARLWVDGVPGNQAGAVADQMSSLTPQGGTNLGDAMDLAYQTALRHYLANGVNRIVLLTDGAANLGNVDPDALKQKVEAHRKQGIALDCFGIGWEGYNDDLLEILSRNGDGRYGFINTPAEAASDFAGQLAGALRVAASDVKVQLEFNPGRVTAYRQIGYAKHQLTKEQFRDNTVDAAEIGAAESGNALYVAEVNARGEGPLAIACDTKCPAPPTTENTNGPFPSVVMPSLWSRPALGCDWRRRRARFPSGWCRVRMPPKSPPTDCSATWAECRRLTAQTRARKSWSG
jgi:Mg-chelatase subunit ChlD/uncharacterized coiled-coil protein SlyX